MIKKIKALLMSLTVAGLSLAPLAVPATVYAQTEIQDGLCAGVQLEANAPCDPNAGVEASDRLNDILSDVINIFSIVVGVAAVIMIIIGGFKYVTSGGDSNNVSGAKNTILAAVIGLVIVALAQFIVKFVLAKATGTA